MDNFIAKYLKHDFYSLLGFVFFLYYFILSVVFYKECVIFLDYAHELSYVIYERDINEIYMRWGIIPFKLWVYVGPYLHLSLKTMFLLTSLWFFVLKFVGWLTCQYYFKNPLAGLLLLASIVLCLNEGFYQQGLQLYDATLYFCILVAVLQDEKRRVIKSNLVRFVLIVLLMVLVCCTHVFVFLLCPLFLIYYSYNNYSPNKLVYFPVIVLIFILYRMLFQNYHEDNYISWIWAAITTQALPNLSGLFVFILKEIVSLNFLFPLAGALFLLMILIKKQKHFLFFITLSYCGFLLLLIFLRLTSFEPAYPWSNDIKFYAQAAFYPLSFIVVALLFYEINETSINDNIFKTSIVFILIFYTSGITASGIEKKEYNIYLESLMKKVEQDFKERIFIIHPNYLPSRFSKLNVLSDEETLIKSNILLNKSIIFYITPFTTPITLNGEFPFIATCAYQINKSNEIDSTKFHFLARNPYTEYSRLDTSYFKFDNYNYVILNRTYMDSFNHQYGFPINEY